MPFQLVIIKGRSANQTLSVPTDGVATVGRQHGCQIRIGSSQVSRKHCELFEKQGQLFVKDLNSSNGTFVNGQKVQGGQQALEPGNILLIGGVSFRVEKAGTPAPAATGAAPAAAAVDVADEADIDFEVVSEDLTVSEPAPATKPTEPAAPADQAPAPEQAPSSPAEQDEFAVPMADQPAEIGEDAVADYLLNIDLDDEDKV